MHILVLDNEVYDLNNIPDELEDDIRFSILDNSDPSDPDFFFSPLIFLESFNSPAMVMQIGDHQIMMPGDWSIAVGDPSSGHDVEVLPLSSLNDRGFEAFVFNPLTSFQLYFKPIEIVNFYNDVKWYFPKMKPGCLLAIPLENKHNPLCAFFVKDMVKQSEIIDLCKIL